MAEDPEIPCVLDVLAAGVGQSPLDVSGVWPCVIGWIVRNATISSSS